MVQERGTSNLDREDPDGDLAGVKRIGDILRQLIDERGWPPLPGITQGISNARAPTHVTCCGLASVGGPGHDTNGEIITNRDEDFAQFVIDLVNRRGGQRGRLGSRDGRS